MVRGVEVVTASGDTVIIPTGGGHAAYYSLSGLAASALVSASAVVLLGWSVIEPTGAAPAVLTLINGPTTAEDVCAAISLATSGESKVGPGQTGVLCERGLTINVLSGEFTGGVYYRRLPA